MKKIRTLLILLVLFISFATYSWLYAWTPSGNSSATPAPTGSASQVQPALPTDQLPLSREVSQTSPFVPFVADLLKAFSALLIGTIATGFISEWLLRKEMSDETRRAMTEV